MKNFLVICLTAFSVLNSIGQNNTVLVYDLENGSIDSSVNIQYDTSILADETSFLS